MAELVALTVVLTGGSRWEIFYAGRPEGGAGKQAAAAPVSSRWTGAKGNCGGLWAGRWRTGAFGEPECAPVGGPRYGPGCAGVEQ